MSAFLPPRFCAAWRWRRLLRRLSFFDGFYMLCALYSRSVVVHDATTCSRENSLYECGRPCDAVSCLFLPPCGSSGASPYWYTRFNHRKIELTCFKTFPITAAICLQVDPCPWSDQCLLHNDDQQRDALPITLQATPEVLQRIADWDGCASFLTGDLRCITWNIRSIIGYIFKLKYLKNLFTNNNTVCLEEVHGKDEYLQAIQVLAPRFSFFFFPFPKMKTQEDRLSALPQECLSRFHLESRGVVRKVCCLLL